MHLKPRHFKILFPIFLALMLVFTSCASINTSGDGENNSNTDNLKVHYIDVGQGDSILVQYKDKNMLIDAGPKSSSDKLINYLKGVGVKNINILIATHPHEDHIGGMVAVLNTFPVEKFYAPKKTNTTKVFENMVSKLKEKDLKINVAKSGVVLDFAEDITATLIAPNSADYENINNYSASLKLTYGKNSFLFMGDAEKVSEKEILQKNLDISSDVIKLGHHGSSTSSSKDFLDKVNPKYAIVSCAKGNDYGHPHKEIIKDMEKRNITVYRTDLQENIVISSDGKNIKVNK
ncbi:ComEC/Rec2 family competence protein [Clostridium putrefaciens]|uniref:ComEC/Rec2 family competence protein n=1 Tax=Clostridium putrefaciens TaxID=99675 RepID=UPI000E2045EA|nr:MBL fold metallo-hydrolase [Clostridium putrefaciens]